MLRRLYACVLSHKSLCCSHSSRRSVDKWFMSQLRHLALLGRCPCMFNERVYACASSTKILELGRYQLPINAITTFISSKEIRQIIRFFMFIEHWTNQCSQAAVHVHSITRAFTSSMVHTHICEDKGSGQNEYI